MLQSGNYYKAKLVNYGLAEDKNEQIKIVLTFEVYDQDNRPTKMYVNLYDRETAWQFTFRVLMELGFDGFNLADLADGPATGLLNMDETYSVKVEENVYNGKTTMRIKSIKAQGSLVNKEGLSKDDAAKLLTKSNMSKAWQEYKTNKEFENI